MDMFRYGLSIICLYQYLPARASGKVGNTFNNLVSTVTNKNLESQKVSSILECLSLCTKRAGCKNAGYYNSGFDTFGQDCKLDLTTAAETDMEEMISCNKLSIPIHRISKKLGGACEDSTCTHGELCEGRVSGGYRCRTPKSRWRSKRKDARRLI